MFDQFAVRFLISSFISSLIIIIMLILKSKLHNHLNARWQYNIYLLILVMLMMPFIPVGFSLTGLYAFAATHININTAEEITNGLTGSTNHISASENWINDFALSMNRSMSIYFNMVVIGIWLAGAFAFCIFTLICNRKINVIKHSAVAVKNKDIGIVFNQCKDKLQINKNLILRESSLAKSPMAVGVIRTYVILPSDILEKLCVRELEHIFMHELYHYKNKDILINYFMCFLQILHWFNPLVYMIFKEIRVQREIACDASVLAMLDKSNFIDYGRTILNFAERFSVSPTLSVTTEMGGGVKQIERRIIKIANFGKETKNAKIKSIVVFIAVLLLIFSQTPVLSTFAYSNNTFSFQDNHVLYEDLSEYFDGFDGSFVLYDLQADQYSIYNKDKSVARVSPNSTYKIYSALVALETNTISKTDSKQSWDGTVYPFELWNHDQELASAMNHSVNWYFQNIDRSVGLRNIKNYFQDMKYGNLDFSGGVAGFWMESSLKISPIEQVMLLTKLYQNETEFSQENVDTVKSVIKLSEKHGAVLSGKTGTGSINGKGVNGWFIGYVERSGHTYIFALNIQDQRNASGSDATKIALSILDAKGIY